MPWYNYGATTRPIATGTRGMVTSAHPLASLAGVRTLLAGGNAIDAAVAVAAALNVVEPYMSGLGGDGYMLVHIARDNRLHALDYVGRSAHAATRAAFADESEKEVGPKAALVPGAPGGWLAAHERFGSLPLDQIFAPAIEYAEGGVPLTAKGATFYGMGQEKLDQTARGTFFPGGRPPVTGEIIRQPHLAATYRALAGGGADEFYRGALGERILGAIRKAGGLLTDRDFADFAPEWQEPIGTTYRGYAIRTVPPPCSGFQYLASLNLLEGYDLAAAGQNSAAAVHLARGGVQAGDRRPDRLRRQTGHPDRRAALEGLRRAPPQRDPPRLRRPLRGRALRRQARPRVRPGRGAAPRRPREYDPLRCGRCRRERRLGHAEPRRGLRFRRDGGRHRDHAEQSQLLVRLRGRQPERDRRRTRRSRCAWPPPPSTAPTGNSSWRSAPPARSASCRRRRR